MSAMLCAIEEETTGPFIGRRHCLTHNVTWDLGGLCPQRDDRAELVWRRGKRRQNLGSALLLLAVAILWLGAPDHGINGFVLLGALVGAAGIALLAWDL